MSYSLIKAVSHCIKLYYILLHCMTLSYIALSWITLHYIVLSCINSLEEGLNVLFIRRYSILESIDCEAESEVDEQEEAEVVEAQSVVVSSSSSPSPKNAQVRVRQSYTYKQKLKCVAECKLIGSRNVSVKHHINQSLLLRWIRESKAAQWDQIGRSGRLQRKLGKTGQTLRYPQQESEMLHLLQERKQAGRSVSRRTAMRLGKQIFGSHPVPMGWFTRFLCRSKMSFRRIQRQTIMPADPQKRV